MNVTMDPQYTSELRRQLVALADAHPRRRPRRWAVLSAAVVASLAVGGVAATAGQRPPGELADKPLSAPLIVNGVGPATLPFTNLPTGATYLRIELGCFDGTRCNTPGGGVEGPGSPKLQRDAIPLTSAFDRDNPQDLDPLPAEGLRIDVEDGTHWRLYATLTAKLNPTNAPVGDGLSLGIPGNSDLPDLVPAVATNGTEGWVDYGLLTDQGRPRLTKNGTAQAPIPVYGDDGVTQVGVADVSEPYQP